MSDSEINDEEIDLLSETISDSTVDVELLVGNEDEGNFYSKYNIVNNITPNILSKYERTKILYERIQHLTLGSKPYINTSNYDNYYDIAVEELNQKKLPYIIKRNIGNIYEYWKISDLIN